MQQTVATIQSVGGLILLAIAGVICSVPDSPDDTQLRIRVGELEKELKMSNLRGENVVAHLANCAELLSQVNRWAERQDALLEAIEKNSRREREIPIP